MKIWIGNKFIDSSYFRTWCLNEELQLVYFIHQPKGAFLGEFSLPLLFSSPEEAKRFYDETWDAMADGSEAIWCLDENATFCWKLYFRIHAQKLQERKERKSRQIQKPHEDIDTQRDVENGTVQGDNAPRETWYHKLKLLLQVRRGRGTSDGVPDSGTSDLQDQKAGKRCVQNVPTGKK